MRLCKILPALAGMALAGCVAGKTTHALWTPIHQVRGIDVRVMESHPEQLAITARGVTRTSGWTHPTFVERRASTAAPDGLLHLVFAATPPTDVAAQVLTPVTATTTRTNHAPRWRGVRIHTETNARTAWLP